MTKAGVPGSTFPLSFLSLEGSDVPGAKSQSLVTLDGLFYFFASGVSSDPKKRDNYVVSRHWGALSQLNSKRYSVLSV